MKTNHYIYSFKVPNIKPNSVFQGTGAITWEKSLDSITIMNHLLKFAISDYNKSTGELINKEDVAFDFISLVNVTE